MQPDVDDPLLAIVARLIDDGVDFIVIGGMAAHLHGTGHSTIDVDVCPSSTVDNLDRLAASLRTMNARLRVESDPHGVPFDPHPQLILQMSSLTMITDLGPLDLCFAPAAFPDGFDDLSATAVSVIVEGRNVSVASLADVVASKRAAGRVKDVVALPGLERHLRRGG